MLAATATARSRARKDLQHLGSPPMIPTALGMELGGASQGLAGADVAGALLGVVDDDDGDGVAALQLAQIGEQRHHFAAGVLIDAMQAHEGIED